MRPVLLLGCLLWLFASPSVSAQLAQHIVISELQVDGGVEGGGAYSDWVELYNPTAAPLDLSNYSLQKQNATGGSFYRKQLSGSIPAYGFYLIVRNDTRTPEVWKTAADVLAAGSSFSLSENFTVFLVNNTEDIDSPQDENILDFVGFGTVTAAEGAPVGNPAAGQSLERRSGAVHVATLGNGWDTDDNSADFFLQAQVNPQNSTATPEPPTTIDPGDPETRLSVTASPPGNLYSESLVVILASSSPEALIYYTLDGATPTEASSIYTEPLILTQDTVLKFFAKDAAGNLSPLQTENYLIRIKQATASVGEVLINEVAWMGSSTSAYDEWIELYNPTSKTFLLDGWRIRDALDDDWEIVLRGELPPQGYLLLERTDDQATPAPADLFFSGSIDNAGEVLTLLDSANNEIDRVDGSADWKIGGAAATAHTLARVDCTNFRTSNEPNGTPRAPNFREHDLAVIGLESAVAAPLPGEEVVFTATLYNAGLLDQSDFSLRWLVDGVAVANVEVPETLASFATIQRSFTYIFTDGAHTSTVEVVRPEDGRTDNNSLTREFLVAWHLLINEFVPDPEGLDSEREWIELYNPTELALDYTGWELNGARLTGGILPREYKLFTASELGGWSPLAAKKGVVFLRDMVGRVVDSHAYADARERQSFGRDATQLGVWRQFFHPTPGSVNLFPELNQAPVARMTIQGTGNTTGQCSLFVNLSAEDSTDADGDTLTYEWTGGNFADNTEVNPAGFYFSPGEYTIQLTVTDALGARTTVTQDFQVAACSSGASTRQNVAIQEAPEIILSSLPADKVVLKLTEIAPDSAQDWIELQMVDDGNGGQGAEIGGFYLEDDKRIKTIPRGVVLKNGEFLLLTFKATEQDATTAIDGVWRIFSTRSGLTATDEQVILRDATGQVEDAVVWENRNGSWSRGEDKDVEELVQAGGWDSAEVTAALDSTQIGREMVLARFPDNRDTDSAQDWFVTTFATPGKPNGQPLVRAKDFHFLFTTIESRNPTGDKVVIACPDCTQPVSLQGFFLSTGLQEKWFTFPATVEVTNTDPVELIFDSRANSLVGNTLYLAQRGLVSRAGLLILRDFEKTVADCIGWSEHGLAPISHTSLLSRELDFLQELHALGEWGASAASSLLDSTLLQRGGRWQRLLPALPDTGTSADWQVLNPDPPLPEPVGGASRVYFSEILPDPIGKDGGAEWFELHNGSTESVDLVGWSISTGKVDYQFADSLILQPGEFRTFADLFSLPNSGATFTLFDYEGAVIESFTYPRLGSGQAFARGLRGWRSTSVPTPSTANIIFRILAPRLDADGDGLSNLEEQTLETDPNLFDTDGDGLPDSFEFERRLDPKLNEATLLDLIDYQKELAGLLTANLVTEVAAHSGFTLSGIGIPNGVVRLYLHSDDLKIVDLVIDATGSWSYALDQALPRGSHTVFAQMLDPNDISGVVRKILTFALVQDFVPPVFASTLRLSEIFPNPAGKDALGEWIEIENYGAETADLAGWRLLSGKQVYSFPEAAVITANSFLLLPRSLTQLALSNTIGKIALLLPTGKIIDQFSYQKTKEAVALAWDGRQFSPTLDPTPGFANRLVTPARKKKRSAKAKPIYRNGDLATAIVLSEILPNPVGSDTKTEWIEIANLGTTAVNLGNWQLDDIFGGSKPFVIPDSVILRPGEQRSLPRSLTKIALNNSGTEAARLFDFRGKLISQVIFRDIPEGMAYARDLDGEFRMTHLLTANLANVFDTQKIQGLIVFLGEDGFVLRDASGEKFIRFGNGSESLLARALFQLGVEYRVFFTENDRIPVLSGFELPAHATQDLTNNLPKLDSTIPWLLSDFFLLMGVIIILRIYLRRHLALAAP